MHHCRLRLQRSLSRVLSQVHHCPNLPGTNAVFDQRLASLIPPALPPKQFNFEDPSSSNANELVQISSRRSCSETLATAQVLLLPLQPVPGRASCPLCLCSCLWSCHSPLLLVSPFPVSLSCLPAVGYALSTILIDSLRCGECSFISPNRFSLLFGLLSLFFYHHEAVSIH